VSLSGAGISKLQLRQGFNQPQSRNRWSSRITTSVTSSHCGWRPPSAEGIRWGEGLPSPHFPVSQTQTHTWRRRVPKVSFIIFSITAGCIAITCGFKAGDSAPYRLTGPAQQLLPTNSKIWSRYVPQILEIST